MVSSVPKNKLLNLDRLFDFSRDLFEVILRRRLYSLLDIPFELLNDRKISALNKIDSFLRSENITTDDMITVLTKCDLSKVTTYNISDVVKYLNDQPKWSKNKIKWGAGNNSDVDSNIQQHYFKHVLSDEGKFWHKLGVITLNDYLQYPLDNFGRMKKVLVHSNGVSTYLSGFVDHIFIIGRYDKNDFGISSCYYVESGEKPGRYSDMLFDVKIQDDANL